MRRQSRDTDAQFRIISDQRATLGQFIRECYDWFRDGCNCDACAVVSSYERGESSYRTWQWRMALLYDLTNGQHSDGVNLPRKQLEMWVNRS